MLLDEYQDTNVAQAELMAALFGGGHPVTAVGDPDQNIYAWRGASPLQPAATSPSEFPRADGTPAARLPLYTNFRSGARILAAADTVIAPIPDAQRPDPDKQLRPVAGQRRGRGRRSPRHSDEWTEARWIAERVRRAARRRAPLVRDRGAVPHVSRLFGLLQRAFDERGVPVEIVGLAGLLKLPEVVEVLAYARAVHDPTASRGARADPARARGTASGSRTSRCVAALGEAARTTRCASTMTEDDVEAEPFLFAEALEHLDEVEDLSDEGRARLEEFRDELRVAARRGARARSASSWAR